MAPIVVQPPRRRGQAPGERNPGRGGPIRSVHSRRNPRAAAPGGVTLLHMVDRTLDDAESRSAQGEVGTPPPARRQEPGARLPGWTNRVPDLLASYLAAVATFCAVTALVPAL